MIRYLTRATVGRICALAFLTTSFAKIPALAQTPQPIFNPPKSYYLALGDSVTYGFQAWKWRAGLPPSAFNTGYVDDFAVRLRQIRPDITIGNYGCPGETTMTFVTGPCGWRESGEQLHDDFSGSQLQAALAFLRAHRGQVSPITLTLWGNDVRLFNDYCKNDPACILGLAPGFIAQLSSNLSTIVEQLRSEAPDAEIIVTGAWDSFLGAFDLADPLFLALNASIAQNTASKRARFADPFPIFNPQGSVDAETQAICTLTLLCTLGDSHPSDAGYQALANVAFDVSGYIRLVD
jgi:lysophospholipase L1-like esterase